MDSYVFTTTFLLGKSSISRSKEFEDFHALIKQVVPRHRRQYGINVTEDEVIAVVNLLTYKLMKLKNKVWEQVEASDRLWFITVKEWRKYATGKLEGQFRHGRQILYLNPNAVSLEKLKDFVDSFYIEGEPIEEAHRAAGGEDTQGGAQQESGDLSTSGAGAAGSIQGSPAGSVNRGGAAGSSSAGKQQSTGKPSILDTMTASPFIFELKQDKKAVRLSMGNNRTPVATLDKATHKELSSPGEVTNGNYSPVFEQNRRLFSPSASNTASLTVACPSGGGGGSNSSRLSVLAGTPSSTGSGGFGSSSVGMGRSTSPRNSVVSPRMGMSKIDPITGAINWAFVPGLPKSREDSSDSAAKDGKKGKSPGGGLTPAKKAGYLRKAQKEKIAAVAAAAALARASSAKRERLVGTPKGINTQPEQLSTGTSDSHSALQRQIQDDNSSPTSQITPEGQQKRHFNENFSNNGNISASILPGEMINVTSYVTTPFADNTGDTAKYYETGGTGGGTEGGDGDGGADGDAQLLFTQPGSKLLSRRANNAVAAATNTTTTTTTTAQDSNTAASDSNKQQPRKRTPIRAETSPENLNSRALTERCQSLNSALNAAITGSGGQAAPISGSRSSSSARTRARANSGAATTVDLNDVLNAAAESSPFNTSHGSGCGSDNKDNNNHNINSGSSANSSQDFKSVPVVIDDDDEEEDEDEDKDAEETTENDAAPVASNKSSGHSNNAVSPQVQVMFDQQAKELAELKQREHELELKMQELLQNGKMPVGTRSSRKVTGGIAKNIQNKNEEEAGGGNNNNDDDDNGDDDDHGGVGGEEDDDDDNSSFCSINSADKVIDRSLSASMSSIFAGTGTLHGMDFINTATTSVLSRYDAGINVAASPKHSSKPCTPKASTGGFFTQQQEKEDEEAEKLQQQEQPPQQPQQPQLQQQRHQQQQYPKKVSVLFTESDSESSPERSPAHPFGPPTRNTNKGLKGAMAMMTRQEQQQQKGRKGGVINEVSFLDEDNEVSVVDDDIEDNEENEDMDKDEDEEKRQHYNYDRYHKDKAYLFVNADESFYEKHHNDFGNAPHPSYDYDDYHTNKGYIFAPSNPASTRATPVHSFHTGDHGFDVGTGTGGAGMAEKHVKRANNEPAHMQLSTLEKASLTTRLTEKLHNESRAKAAAMEAARRATEDAENLMKKLREEEALRQQLARTASDNASGATATAAATQAAVLPESMHSVEKAQAKSGNSPVISIVDNDDNEDDDNSSSSSSSSDSDSIDNDSDNRAIVQARRDAEAEIVRLQKEAEAEALHMKEVEKMKLEAAAELQNLLRTEKELLEKEALEAERLAAQKREEEALKEAARIKREEKLKRQEEKEKKRLERAASVKRAAEAEAERLRLARKQAEEEAAALSAQIAQLKQAAQDRTNGLTAAEAAAAAEERRKKAEVEEKKAAEEEETAAAAAALLARCVAAKSKEDEEKEKEKAAVAQKIEADLLEAAKQEQQAELERLNAAAEAARIKLAELNGHSSATNGNNLESKIGDDKVTASHSAGIPTITTPAALSLCNPHPPLLPPPPPASNSDDNNGDGNDDDDDQSAPTPHTILPTPQSIYAMDNADGGMITATEEAIAQAERVLQKDSSVAAVVAAAAPIAIGAAGLSHRLPSREERKAALAAAAERESERLRNNTSSSLSTQKRVNAAAAAAAAAPVACSATATAAAATVSASPVGTTTAIATGGAPPAAVKKSDQLQTSQYAPTTITSSPAGNALKEAPPPLDAAVNAVLSSPVPVPVLVPGLSLISVEAAAVKEEEEEEDDGDEDDEDDVCEYDENDTQSVIASASVALKDPHWPSHTHSLNNVSPRWSSADSNSPTSGDNNSRKKPTLGSSFFNAVSLDSSVTGDQFARSPPHTPSATAVGTAVSASAVTKRAMEPSYRPAAAGEGGRGMTSSFSIDNDTSPIGSSINKTPPRPPNKSEPVQHTNLRKEEGRNANARHILQYFRPFLFAAMYQENSSIRGNAARLQMIEEVTYRDKLFWALFQLYGSLDHNLLVKSIKISHVGRTLREGEIITPPVRPLTTPDLDDMYSRISHAHGGGPLGANSSPGAKAVAVSASKGKVNISAGALKPSSHNLSHAAQLAHGAPFLAFQELIESVVSYIARSSKKSEEAVYKSIEAKFDKLLGKGHADTYGKLLNESEVSFSGVLLDSVYTSYTLSNEPHVASDFYTPSGDVPAPPHSPGGEVGAPALLVTWEYTLADVYKVRSVWDRNAEQMRQIYAYYATNYEIRRIGGGAAAGLSSSSRHSIISTDSNHEHRLLASYENLRELLTDFNILPKLIDAQLLNRIFRSCLLWQWRLADAVVDSAHAARYSIDMSDSDPLDFCATIGNFCLTLSGFIEFITRVACHNNHLGTEAHECVENLLHLIDASGGKAKLAKAPSKGSHSSGGSRRGVNVKPFVYILKKRTK